MNKAALMGSALLLAACGVPGVVGAVSSPDGGPFPTPASATMPPEKSSTPTTTPTETATPTAEIINYGICETEKFRECSIPSEDLFNGKYLAFLETLSKPFDVNTMKQVPWINVGPDNFLAPDITTAPNFTNISTIGAESGADFRRGVTSGITTYEGKNYMVLPVEFYDKENPDKNVWVITIYPLFFQKQDYPESLDAKLFDAWRNRTKVPALYIEKGPDTQIFGNTPVLSYKTFDEDPSMAQRLADFVAGKRSSLHGKVLRTALDFRKSDIYN